MTTTEQTTEDPTPPEPEPADPPGARTLRNIGPPRHSNVIAALAAVMADLPGIGKTERSDQGYNYRGIEAITAEVQHLFGKHCVVPVVHVVSREVREFTINNRPWTEDHLVVEYTIYGPGGPDDYITIGPIHSLGRDNSDKGISKCLTMAYKYMLIQTLCVGDAKDDSDREEAHTADTPPTPDELAQRDGWDDLAHFQTVRAAVRPALQKFVEDRKMSHDQAGARWTEYQRPDGDDRPARARTLAEHERFVADHLNPEALPAGDAQSPPDTRTPPAPPQPGSGEPPAAQGAESKESRVPPPPEYPRTSHRDELDVTMAEHGVNGLLAALDALSTEDVVRALGLRGAANPPGPANAMRSRLFDIVTRTYRETPAVHPPQSPDMHGPEQQAILDAEKDQQAARRASRGGKGQTAGDGEQG
ncbi:MAG: ERF family protein [Acidimicrobiales bacterium]